MTDENNPEEKPSFFDGDAGEATSWPPSEKYEIEEEEPAFSEIEDSADVGFLSESPETNIERNIEVIDDEVDESSEPESESELDIPFIDAETDLNQIKIIDDESDDHEYQIQAPAEPEVPISPELKQNNESLSNQSYDNEFNYDPGLSGVVNQAEMQASISDIDDDFNIDELIEESEPIAPQIDETPTVEKPTPPIVITEPEPVNETIEEEYNFEEEPSFVEDKIIEEDLKPFRTFSKHGFEDVIVEDDEDDDAVGGFLAGINRNVLIIVGILLLILFYFLFSSVFNRSYKNTGRTRKPRPRKEKRINVQEKQLIPVWEIASQKYNSSNESRYIENAYSNSGRTNPFAFPQSVIAELQKIADLEEIKKQKPNSYRRKAYRATLIGVLTSKDNTIALVNVQEATFDVVEGTKKSKILKLATKSMDKARKNTLEMGPGSYIGPWVITKVEAPTGAFNDAKVYIEFEDTRKILYMGKAEELGIFTEEGQIDNLEEDFDEDEDF